MRLLKLKLANQEVKFQIDTLYCCPKTIIESLKHTLRDSAQKPMLDVIVNLNKVDSNWVKKNLENYNPGKLRTL